MDDIEPWTEPESGSSPLKNRPPQPDGYAEPYEFRYPTVWLILGSVFLGIGTSAVVIGLLGLFHEPSAFTFYESTVEGETTTWTVDVTALAVPFLVAIVVTVVVHELLHGLVFRLYGYDVRYGVIPSMGAFYAAVFGEFQARNELFHVGLAPLVVLTVVCLPLLVVPVLSVAITAAFVLILNTAGAIGDLYLTWRLWKLPPETLLYDVDIQQMYIYEPLRQ